VEAEDHGVGGVPSRRRGNEAKRVIRDRDGRCCRSAISHTNPFEPRCVAARACLGPPGRIRVALWVHNPCSINSSGSNERGRYGLDNERPAANP
jgi:hypothetical protein